MYVMRMVVVVVGSNYDAANLLLRASRSPDTFSVYIRLTVASYTENHLQKKTSSVYYCAVEDVEYIHVVIALTGAHMQPACVTELTSSEY